MNIDGLLLKVVTYPPPDGELHEVEPECQIVGGFVTDHSKATLILRDIYTGALSEKLAAVCVVIFR